MTSRTGQIEVPAVNADRAAGALARARGVIAGFLTARPGLTHSLPSDAEARGGAWPSPRTWDMALRLLVFHFCAGTSREALAIPGEVQVSVTPLAVPPEGLEQPEEDLAHEVLGIRGARDAPADVARDGLVQRLVQVPECLAVPTLAASNQSGQPRIA